MTRHLILVLALVGWLGNPCPALAQKDPPHMGHSAADLAKQLGSALTKRLPKAGRNKIRVAVFPFGNNEGKYPLEMGDNGPVLRGVLIDELRSYLDKNAPGRFTVLYPEQIDDEIKASSVDPAGLSGKHLTLARK